MTSPSGTQPGAPSVPICQREISARVCWLVEEQSYQETTQSLCGAMRLLLPCTTYECPLELCAEMGWH